MNGREIPDVLLELYGSKLWVSSSSWGYPHSWMVYFMGIPFKMNDDWGYPYPHLLEATNRSIINAQHCQIKASYFCQPCFAMAGQSVFFLA